MSFRAKHPNADEKDIQDHITQLLGEVETLSSRLRSEGREVPTTPALLKGVERDCIHDLDTIEAHLARLRVLEKSPGGKFMFTADPLDPKNLNRTLGYAVANVKAAEDAIRKAGGNVPQHSAEMLSTDPVALTKAWQGHLQTLESYCSKEGIELGALMEQYGLKLVTPSYDSITPQPVASESAADPKKSMKEEPQRKLNATERARAAIAAGTKGPHLDNSVKQTFTGATAKALALKEKAATK